MLKYNTVTAKLTNNNLSNIKLYIFFNFHLFQSKYILKVNDNKSTYIFKNN